MNKADYFGPHLIMDLYGCPPEILADLRVHFDHLNEMPVAIGMTKITQPYVFPYSGLVPEDEGITGTVIIAESHLSVHSFTQKGVTFLDVFSCKPFDVNRAIAEIVARFRPTHYDHWVIKRGLEFPHTLS